MKRKQRYGDITIHSRAYVGGVLRSKYPHQRESFGAYALKRVLAVLRRLLELLVAPFLFIADALGSVAERIVGLGKKRSPQKPAAIPPLYLPSVPMSEQSEYDALPKPRFFKPSVITALCALVPVTAFLVAFMIAPREDEALEVYLVDQGVRTAFRTDSSTVGEFLDRNVSIDSSDVVMLERSRPIEEGMTISVKRAFPVIVTSKQNTGVVELAGGTVRDALEKLSIVVKPSDIVTPPMDYELSAGTKIEHIQVETKLETETVRLPFKKETVKDSSLVKGKTKLKTEGRSGRKNIVTRVVLHDGVEISRELVQEVVTREPVNQVTLEGTASDTIKAKSLLNLKNDNRSQKGPPKTSQIKTSMVIEATAYTHTGNKTATGTTPKVGTVAVDPKVIPYGTKLYIEGYGYGRAEDTGAFRGREKKQIDLFMDTVKECVNWGRKDVTIYILK